ncbi:hypothetical protein TrCOL_g2622 [Triparma columacea]|uniref:Leucine-rich repeat domain-containing protein n=1 Tax=Triparma columacea TaxID=722753 RepID=A0A9W7LB80_9STRA|nr:hypothetical protein TrCOL_g2622 [Triparma columacea]
MTNTVTAVTLEINADDFQVKYWGEWKRLRWLIEKQGRSGQKRSVQTSEVNLVVKGIETLQGKQGEHGMDLFYNSINLTSVSFPDMAGDVGYKSFFTCSKLQSASFPNARYIGRYAFSGCRALTHVSIPRIHRIDDFAFSPCFQLRHVDLPSSAKVGKKAFFNCFYLEALAASTNFEVAPGVNNTAVIAQYLHWRCEMDKNKELFKTMACLLKLCSMDVEDDVISSAKRKRAYPANPLTNFLVEKGGEEYGLAKFIMSWLGTKRGEGDLRAAGKDKLYEIARQYNLLSSVNESWWMTPQEFIA